MVRERLGQPDRRPLSDASPRVRVRGLRKRYGAVEAVRGVDLEVAAGEIFGLIGPNGAGKTTTLECLLGLRVPDAGEIEVCGLDARRNPRAVRERLGAALQTTALQDRITPREALALFGSFFETHLPPDALLERFSLQARADAPFDSLSGGQRQRLALALAFVNRPQVVVLDEPTTGLDPQARRDLHGEIVRMRADGVAVLVTTHDLVEAQLLCDRVAIIDHGRVIALGSPDELVARSRARPRVNLTLARPADESLLAGVPGVSGVEWERERVRFSATDVTAALAVVMARLAAAGAETRELSVRRATLEDVFLELTGGALRD